MPLNRTEASRILGGTLLIAGVSIGGGIASLPQATVAAGFFPTVAALLLNGSVMLMTGLFLAKLCLAFDEKVNLLTLSSHFLGKWGRWVTGGGYLLLFYSLIVAYLGGIGESLAQLFSFSPSWIILGTSSLAFLLFLGGIRWIDRCNRLLMIGLFLTLSSLLAFGWRRVDSALISRTEWSKVSSAFPLILTSFGFQGTVPSLVDYLGRRWSSIWKAIVLGCMIPLLVYVAWEYTVLGLLPPDSFVGESSCLVPLMKKLREPLVNRINSIFFFFIFSTSLLGVSLGLIDFLSDGLSLPAKGKARALLLFFIFFPTTCFTLLSPHLFFSALKYGAAPAAIWILGILPSWMMRNHLGHNSCFFYWGFSFFLLFFLYLFGQLSVVQ